jgi:hypothetical protein
MMTATLTQQEYKTFQRKVNGLDLDHTVVGKNKRSVKVTLNKEYDLDELERLSGGVK